MRCNCLRNMTNVLSIIMIIIRMALISEIRLFWFSFLSSSPYLSYAQRTQNIVHHKACPLSCDAPSQAQSPPSSLSRNSYILYHEQLNSGLPSAHLPRQLSLKTLPGVPSFGGSSASVLSLCWPVEYSLGESLHCRSRRELLISGVYSLTLALMGSDDLNLRVLSASSSNPKERKAANKVLRLLARGRHWVLVVLLLGNVVSTCTLSFDT